MPIVSSVLQADAVQRDLRRAVIERHTDHLGVVHRVHYLAESQANAAATMVARVPLIEAGLAESEIQRNVGHILSGQFGRVTAQHTTLPLFRAALRELYREGSGEAVGRLATFLLTLSDARLRGLFNIGQGQVAALRNRLQTRAAVVAALDGLTGE